MSGSQGEARLRLTKFSFFLWQIGETERHQREHEAFRQQQ